MKKLISLVLALAMVALCIGAAVADDPTYTITINRDPSYVEGTNNATTYTYYKILTATITSKTEVDEDTGALDGTPGNVVYTVDTAAKATAISNTGLFTVEQSAGDSLYYVTLTNSSTTAEAIAAAFKTMVEADGSPFTAETQLSEGAVTTIEVDAGYYLILANNGNKMIVQTLADVEIKEKNTYPTITKEEMDPEVAEATFGKTAPNVSVGDDIDYQITVHVPADANADITVTDTMSTGLTSKVDLKINNVAVADLVAANFEVTSNTTSGFVAVIKNTEANRGTDVVFTVTATVNSDAIVNEKLNEVELDYGNYHVVDSVPYKTYKTAAYKYDGADYTEELANVVFTLKEGADEFPVSLHTDGYYYPDTAGSASVTTNTDGLIIIRGLDNEKTYTLTETHNPNPGYNMVKDPVTLTLIEDTATDVTAYDPTVGTQLSEKGNEVSAIANNKGTELPSTGGIGTTIFYIVGGMLLVGAAIVLVARRKASEN